MDNKPQKLDHKQKRKNAQMVLKDRNTMAAEDLLDNRSRIAVLPESVDCDSRRVLRIVRENCENSGLRVIGVSQEYYGSRSLQRLTGIQSVDMDQLYRMLDPTRGHYLKHYFRQLKRLLQNRQVYSINRLKIDKKIVLVVDGADNCNRNEIEYLLRTVKRQRGKIILVKRFVSKRLSNTALNSVATQIHQQQLSQSSKRQFLRKWKTHQHSQKKKLKPTM